MPALQLSQITAFSTGSDLWILPSHSRTKIALRLDWLMNFQKSRSETHLSEKLSQNLELILLETELPKPNLILNSGHPLAIPGASLVPAKWVVYAPWAENESQSLDRWIQSAFKTWKDLGSPSLRFFLPSGVLASDFQKKWKDISNFEDYSLVLD